jgi:Ca2+:H+ antiporter
MPNAAASACRSRSNLAATVAVAVAVAVRAVAEPPVGYTRKMPKPWRKLDLLVAALPVAVVADLLSAPAPLLFIVGALAVVPLAGLIGRATESIAEEVGGTIGALLNATFGTFAELVIAALLVLQGEIEIVKASVVGSLVGNLLLLLGVSILLSSYDRTEIAFHRASRVQSTMLFLAVGIFVLPTLFSLRGESTPLRTDEISDVIAVVLIALYALALLFTMRTHRSVFRGGAEARQPASSDKPTSDERVPDPVGPSAQPENEPGKGWSIRGAVAVLGSATVLVTVAAEIVAGSVQEAGSSLGLTTGFLGFIILPLVGNAAEQFSALTLAAKDRLDVAAEISVGASIQLVMLVVPLLVLVGAIGGHSFSLVFEELELAVLIVSTLLVRQLVDDRKSNWFEGVMLLALYVAFAAAAFFVEV